MRPIHFAVPGDLSAPTGGYAYARALLRCFSTEGIAATHVALPAGYPFPTADDIAETERQFAKIPTDGIALIDGLAFGAMPEALVAALPQKIVALVHHPLGFENGLSDRQKFVLLESERRALRHADRIVVSSRTTARELVAHFGVEADDITVAEPGVAEAERAVGSTGETRALLAVGAVSERKGYDVLVSALAQLPRDGVPAWHLTIAGACDRAPDVAARLRAQVEALELGPQITLAGAVTDAALSQLYATADVFVLSSRYEGYGMVLTEALSRGLAIVSTTGGAAAETVPDAAALKVAPDDADALARALATVMSNSDTRQELAAAAWATAKSLPRWSDTARTIATVLKEVS